MQPAIPRDGTAVALLILGVVLAVVATALPVIQVQGASGPLTMTTWEILPWFTKVKVAALALLLAAAFLPGLHKWRLAIAAVAVIMVFVPAIASFISAVYAWGSVRSGIVQATGTRNPFVHPGLANAVLVVGAVMISMAVWRLEQHRHQGAPLPA